MSNECIIISTDVCTVSLKYMRVLLIDWQINVCFRKSSTIPRHGLLGSSSIMDLCLGTESCTVMCSVTADRFESLVVFYAANMSNSLCTVIDKLHSPAFLLGYSPSLAKLLQWECYSSHHRQISLLLTGVLLGSHWLLAVNPASIYFWPRSSWSGPCVGLEISKPHSYFA